MLIHTLIYHYCTRHYFNVLLTYEDPINCIFQCASIAKRIVRNIERASSHQKEDALEKRQTHVGEISNGVHLIRFDDRSGCAV